MAGDRRIGTGRRARIGVEAVLHPRLCAVLDGMPDVDGHILYVDDGSHDGTWQVIAGLAQGDARVSALKL
ncbi:hypothetical protein C7E14_22975, partial [Stenotrophomonas maltophilia]